MIAKVTEYGGCFEVGLQPEGLADATLLVRMAMVHKREPSMVYCFADQDSTLRGRVVIPKLVTPHSKVPRCT